MPVTRWLSHDEQALWRAWLTAIALVPERLGRELQDEWGINLSDYDILVRLSETDGHALRMSELASKTLVSRSRLTHQVDRLERAGLVERRVCEQDGRGLIARMTDQGWELLQKAAHSHVRSVREHLVDVLTPEEFTALGKASEKLVHALGATVELPK